MANEQAAEQVERLNTIRSRAQELAAENSRLQGEKQSLEKRMAELEERCNRDFECGVKGLPALLKELETQADKSLRESERLLGLSSGSDTDERAEPEGDEDGLAV